MPRKLSSQIPSGASVATSGNRSSASASVRRMRARRGSVAERERRGVAVATERAEDELGVGALWLSPLNENPDGFYPGRDGYESEAYHGYWASEPRQVEQRFGGEEALDELAHHARGYVVWDRQVSTSLIVAYTAAGLHESIVVSDPSWVYVNDPSAANDNTP